MLTNELQGLDQVQQRLQAVLAQMVQAAPPALVDEGQRILQISEGLVPVDTGLLRSTAHLELFTAYQAIVLELSYGLHGTAPYAALQHEDTSLNHPHGGQSHYLSEPFFAATSGMLERLGVSIWTGMGG